MSSDERILELQEQIDAKRKELGDAPEFEPVTDGDLMMANGKWVELHTMPKDTAIGLLVDLNGRRMSAEDLGIPYKVGEHSIDDWVADLQAYLVHLEYKQECRRLERLESKLDRLLSEEKKKARKIEDIASEIVKDDD